MAFIALQRSSGGKLKMTNKLSKFSLMLSFLRRQPEKTIVDTHDFTNLQKTTQHGFPSQIAAFAFDSILGILAIATETGEISLYGDDNYQWHSSLTCPLRVAHLFFAEGTGTLVALCHDQSFHRFSISGRELSQYNFPAEQRLKRITSCAMYLNTSRSKFNLLVGTLTGNIYALDIDDMQMSEFLIFQDEFASRVNLVCTDSSELSSIDVRHSDPSQLLLIFDRSVVVYDASVREVVSTWNLESVPTSANWSLDGSSIVLAFNDGSFCTYSPSGQIIEDVGIVFGPFPCTSVNKLLIGGSAHGQLSVFSGGMPKPSYADRFTLTTMRAGKTVCWDFPSKIIDFCFSSSFRDQNENSARHVDHILVLTEEELVVLNVAEKEWKVEPLRCLFPLHASQITHMVHTGNIQLLVWRQMLKLSKVPSSSNSWPLRYAPENFDIKKALNERQVLLTGHANGNVNIWSTGEPSMHLLYTIETNLEIAGSSDEERNMPRSQTESELDPDEQASEEWPPFKKVGEYDPCSDDLRLAIQRLALDPCTGTLAVACRGGHALVYQLCDSEQMCDSPSVLDCSLIKDKSSIANGIRALKSVEPRRRALLYPPGYQPRPFESSSASLIIQLSPCVPIASIALNGTRNLLALGTEFGLAVINFATPKAIFCHSLLEQAELSDAGALDDALNRFKSMKKSIRQSFRRKTKAVPHDTSGETGTEICRPIERRIEARGVQAQGAMIEPSRGLVRFLRFLPNPLIPATAKGDALFVGTNGGRLLVYSIGDSGETCKLERELRLQHGAPILYAEVFHETVKSCSIARLLLVTEEQIKGYSLPQLRPTKYKLKLTANEGLRVRRNGVATLQNIKETYVSDSFLVILTNVGDTLVFSLQHHRKFSRVPTISQSDVAGIASCVISCSGELFYLKPGGSLLQRANLCAPAGPNTVSL